MEKVHGRYPDQTDCDAVSLLFAMLMQKLGGQYPFGADVLKENSLMYLLPVLLQLESCTDLANFKRILDGLLNPTQLGPASKAKAEATKQLGKANQKMVPYSANHLLNFYVFACEAELDQPFDPNAECCTAKEALLVNECTSRGIHHYRFEEMIGKHAYTPDPLSKKGFATDAKVYVLQGLLDYSTPYDDMAALFESYQASNKKLLLFRNLGHNIIRKETLDCVSQIVDELLGRKADGASCLEKLNERPLDWSGSPTGKKVLSVLPRTRPANPFPSYKGPPISAKSGTGYKISNTKWIAIGVTAGLLVLCVAIYLIIRRFRR